MRCVRAANALLAQAIGGNAGKPSLETLELPADVKLDPFDGQPLRLKETETGWIIYSIGHDGKDDGGATDKYQDIVVGPFRISAP